MSSTAERRLTEGQKKELQQKAKEIVESFREALRGNDVFKEAAARYVTPEKAYTTVLEPVRFTFGDSDYCVSFGLLIADDSLSLQRYKTGKDEVVEALNIACGDDPLIAHTSYDHKSPEKGLFRFDAIAPAQKMLEGLKPEEKS